MHDGNLMDGCGREENDKILPRHDDVMVPTALFVNAEFSAGERLRLAMKVVDVRDLPGGIGGIHVAMRAEKISVIAGAEAGINVQDREGLVRQSLQRVIQKI